MRASASALPPALTGPLDPVRSRNGQLIPDKTELCAAPVVKGLSFPSGVPGSKRHGSGIANSALAICVVEIKLSEV